MRRVEQHFAGCPTCPRFDAALVGTTEALKSSSARDPDTVVPPDLAERLHGAPAVRREGSPSDEPRP